MNEISLGGCAPEPLMSYLKALGILRIVGEQVERQACGAWRQGRFLLRSRFSATGLTDFLLRDYRPTPILVPWSGADFFAVDEKGDPGPFGRESPSGTKIIEAFLATPGERLEHYREAIRITLQTMKAEGITSKRDFEDRQVKSRFLAAMRSRASDLLVEWIDTAAAIQWGRPYFNVLLGSGGGSDGNTHFSDNFMQNLWDVLPDFDSRRKGKSQAEKLLRGALFGVPVAELSDRTGALFDSGAVGGPNADVGFEGSSILNPWNFILAMEGAICFAGAVTRRLNARGGLAAFPFSVALSAAGYGTAAAKEENQREIWMPLWERFATFAELRLILSEGRAQVGAQTARTGSDFARAVSSFGVDAGIGSFIRYGFLKGRVGGENYHTAVPLGQFTVAGRSDADLLLEIDGWLERFRHACREETAPPHFAAAMRRIDGAILDFSRYGGRVRMQAILRALGQAERQLANGERFRSSDKRPVPPIGSLSVHWVAACDDGSPEFRLAAAIASIRGAPDGRVPELRCGFEPVRRENRRWVWESGTSSWKSGNLTLNLLGALEKRLLECSRQGMTGLALSARSWAWLPDLSVFLWKLCDDRAIEELLWGLFLVDRETEWPAPMRPDSIDAPPLPRSYALMKLLFLPAPLKITNQADPVTVPPEPAILARLRAGDSRGACRIAARRLRSCGLPSALKDGEELDPAIEAQRLGAAVLAAVAQTRDLARMVLQPVQQVNES